MPPVRHLLLPTELPSHLELALRCQACVSDTRTVQPRNVNSAPVFHDGMPSRRRLGTRKGSEEAPMGGAALHRDFVSSAAPFKRLGIHSTKAFALPDVELLTEKLPKHIFLLKTAICHR
jgi:hypothetical protein